MAYNLIECNREQTYLMPISLRDWLPEGHLSWFILDAVEAIDLLKFYLKYRADGWGRAAYDPRMMVSLLLYAYCLGARSSRQIERLRSRCSFSSDHRKPETGLLDNLPLSVGE